MSDNFFRISALDIDSWKILQPAPNGPLITDFTTYPTQHLTREDFRGPTINDKLTLRENHKIVSQ